MEERWGTDGMNNASPQSEVAEFQGLYAPFTVTEKLLQKIWLRGDFNVSAARTLGDEAVEILFPGKWNLLGGPDFREARLKIGGREVTGDVELHFHCGDWFNHGHHKDPAYDRVVLHVLLFRPEPRDGAAMTAAGGELPCLALLELLHHDLEEYAVEDAIEASLARDHWQVTEELIRLPLADRRASLRRQARGRWEQKVRFARLRLEKLGWVEACHQTFLEILGYRRNRAAMLNAGTRYPLALWREERPTEEMLWRSGRWTVQGARPANHPRQRLRQYLQVVEARPDWPERLRQVFGRMATGKDDLNELDPGVFRARLKLKALREKWADEVTGGLIRGTRLDTLWCDGFFPLATADGGADFFPYWFNWYAGDFPDRVVQTLRTAEITDRSRYVTCNGFCQGVLSLSLEKRDDPLA